jgi:hypothetical protein
MIARVNPSSFLGIYQQKKVIATKTLRYQENQAILVKSILVPVAMTLVPASRHPRSKENPAQATLAMGQRWVIAAHVWLELVNCTADVLRVTAVEVRTCRERLLGLRINPDPAKTVNAVEKILPPRLTPALQVSGGGVQMTTEGLATLTTLQTGFWPFRLVFAFHQGTQEGKHLKPLVRLTTKGIFRHPS